MRTKIPWLAVLPLVVALGLLAYTAHAGWQVEWWEKTVDGYTLKQGVAMDLNRSEQTLWGTTVTWVDATFYELHAWNAGGEWCPLRSWVFWENERYQFSTNSTYVTGYDHYPDSRPCAPRLMRVRGISHWWYPYYGISESHEIKLTEEL